MSDTQRNLVALRTGRQLLDNSNSLEEIKSIRDKAEAIRKYAKSATDGLVLQNAAAELKLRAERSAGELLQRITQWGGDRRSSSQHKNLKLKALGINHNLSARWKLMAQIPENTFQQFIDDANQNGCEITSEGLLRLARKLKRKPQAKTSKRRRFSEAACHSTAHARIDELNECPLQLLNEVENHCELLARLLLLHGAPSRDVLAGPELRDNLTARRLMAEICGDLAKIKSHLQHLRLD